MKTIIAGSRSIMDFNEVCRAVAASGFKITAVISGNANGVDELGERYAIYVGVPCVLFPVRRDEWRRSRGAGHMRNRRMAEYGEQLIAVWDGVSPGTKGMIAAMEALRKPVYVHRVTVE